MSAVYQSHFLLKIRALWFIIKVDVFMIALVCRQPSRPRRKTPKLWVLSWICQRSDKGCCNNIFAELFQSDIPGYQNFVRMPLAIFDLIQEQIHHHLKKDANNFRQPLKEGLKLAIALRHLATGKSYKSLGYQEVTNHCGITAVWGEPLYVNLFLFSSRTSLTCATLLKNGDRSFTTDGISPCAIDSFD